MIRLSVIILIFMQLSGLLNAQEGKVYSIEWRIAGSIPASADQLTPLGVAGAIVGKINHYLIVAGGCNFPDSMPWQGGKKKYYNDVFVFVKNESGNFDLHCKTKLPFSVAYAASCNTANGILFAGGENESGISQKVFLLQWNESTREIAIHSLPDLPMPITNASVVSKRDKVYFAGGETTNSVSDKFWMLDLKKATGDWESLPPLPAPLSHAVMSIQSDGKTECFYLIGGRRKRIDSVSQFYSTNFKFDLNTKKWSKKNLLPHALSAGTVVALGSKYILLIGGDEGKTFQKTEELIMAINKESNEEKKILLTAEKAKLQSSHPGFSKQVLLYNTVTDKWTSLDPIPTQVPVTTTALNWENSIVIPGGEIKAGIRSASILVGEIKNTNSR